jgi:rhodanese-related sulfurtransferase
VALILRRRGIERVRPLAGGFHAWRDRGYPTISLSAATDSSSPRPVIA